MPTQISATEKFCFECGEVIRAKAEICPKCGVRQPDIRTAYASAVPTGKNRLAAALLAIILGGIGAHKFYLGRVWQGILYLLFCWTFIPVVVGIIEGLVYLASSDQAFAAKYG